MTSPCSHRRKIATLLASGTLLMLAATPASAQSTPMSAAAVRTAVLAAESFGADSKELDELDVLEGEEDGTSTPEAPDEHASEIGHAVDATEDDQGENEQADADTNAQADEDDQGENEQGDEDDQGENDQADEHDGANAPDSSDDDAGGVGGDD